MYDPRNRLAAEVSTQLLKHFRDKVYDTIIPRNVRLAEAPSFGLSAILHDRTSRGAQAYVQLAEEIVRRGDTGAGGLKALPQPRAVGARMRRIGGNPSGHDT